MKRLTILFFVISGFLVCGFGQNYSNNATDEEITSFLEWEVKNSKKYKEEPFFFFRRRVLTSIFDWRVEHFKKEKDGNSFYYLFSREKKLDTIFYKDSIYEQLSVLKTGSWLDSFKGVKLTKKEKNYYYKYSIPLFSSSKEYVLFKREFFCGNLCVYGGVYLYKKIENNKWKKIDVVKSWSV